MTTSALDIARDLIRCASVTPADEGALDVVQRYLSAAGFACERVTFSAPGTPDIDNLYARIGTQAPCLMFAGHTDVVPPGDAAHWRFPPFSAEVTEGQLWGRGAVDMKGGLAASMAAAIAHVATHATPKGSIAFLITGDQVVLVAIDTMVSVARADRIPVFTIIPPNVRKGTLFDLGANFSEVGHDVGVLAGQVLAGADIAKTPVSNHVPETLSLNLTALKGLRGNWKISPELLARADRWIDDAGEHRKGGALAAPAASAAASAASR